MEIKIKAEGPRVHVGIDARTFLDIGPKEAEQFGRALIEAAKRAAEVTDAERIILDSAILLRAGSNFALSNDRRIIDGAKTAAAHDRNLRRYMSHGIKSSEAFGLPTIRRGAPKK